MQAFKYVYNQYRQRIFSYCLYVTGNKSSAEDAFQEVFIRVFERREQLRETYAIKKWLLLVARTVCLNMIRESKYLPDFIYVDDNSVREIDIRIEGFDSEFSEEVFQIAFRNIAPIYREAFILKEIEGFSYAEIAEMTGASESNVKVRVLRAKRMLRKMLAPHFRHREKTSGASNDSSLIESYQDEVEAEQVEKVANIV